MTQTTTLPTREEVPVEQTWDLESIFPTEEAWLEGYREVEAQFPELAKFQGKLSENPQTLAAYLETVASVYHLAEKVALYPALKGAVDTTNQAALAKSGQARSLLSNLEEATAFSEPEIMEIGFETLADWLKREPRLEIYKHRFDRLQKRAPHIRSPEVEGVLAAASDPLSTAMATYDLLTSGDLQFKPARDSDGNDRELAQSSINALITHKDRRVRKTAWKSYADSYLAFKSTLTNSLITAVKRDVFYIRARGYSSSLEASLAPNNIPIEVFHNLIEVFKKNLPTWHRYWRIRRKALGYKKLHVYDLKAPLISSPPSVSFLQAVEWIAAGMEPLGREYIDVLRKGCLEERWIDYARNKGKRAGAFSSGGAGTHPFIMMSFADDIFSLSTLAHELGHSMHSYYSYRTQPYVYAHYSLFVAEVASNFNQAMTRAYLFENLRDREFQIALIEEAMSNFHRYFFIMPTLARFELEMHERVERGSPINAKNLIGLMADLFKEGYGEEVEYDRDRIGITWAQFGHLYRNFYVYQYATGISGAHALADGILSGKEGAAEKYLDFLKAGGSMYPLDALKMAGVDLETPEPVEKTFQIMANMIDKLESFV